MSTGLLAACVREDEATTATGPSAMSPTGADAAQEATSAVGATQSPVLALAGFAAFADLVTLDRDTEHWLIDSAGMPSHPMMVGITSWQQQVPTPQPYTGDNRWRLPLTPQLADDPISARTGLYRGAIGLAVNGVPIFNALNNRGEDALLAGELDEYGGHAGRGDDYHYHVAPLHLQEFTGAAAPIAYALDGFPIYGETEPNGTAVRELDELNGHLDDLDGYHYHGTQSYPYVNGGLRGVVASIVEDQVEPQPRVTPFRPAGEPLRGATVVAFEQLGTASWMLGYDLDEQRHEVAWDIQDDAATFSFTAPSGTVESTTYTR